MRKTVIEVNCSIRPFENTSLLKYSVDVYYNTNLFTSNISKPLETPYDINEITDMLFDILLSVLSLYQTTFNKNFSYFYLYAIITSFQEIICQHKKWKSKKIATAEVQDPEGNWDVPKVRKYSRERSIVNQ